MKQTGVIYFYNLNNAKGQKIRMLCIKLGLKICVVDKSRYLVPIGSLSLSVDEIDAFTKYEGEGFYDEMLVMKFYNPYMLDTFLKGFKAMKIAPVALKAVLTETNSQWDSIRLHDELLEEHRAMHGL